MRAELTGIDIREVIAYRTAADGSFDLENGLRKLGCVGLIHLQDEKCKALRGFCADAG